METPRPWLIPEPVGITVTDSGEVVVEWLPVLAEHLRMSGEEAEAILRRKGMLGPPITLTFTPGPRCWPGEEGKGD